MMMYSVAVLVSYLLCLSACWFIRSWSCALLGVTRVDSCRPRTLVGQVLLSAKEMLRMMYFIFVLGTMVDFYHLTLGRPISNSVFVHAH
jgi:hypothetical protein